MAAERGCLCRIFLIIISWLQQLFRCIFCCFYSRSTKLKKGYKPVKVISLGNYRSYFFYPKSNSFDDDEEVRFLVRTFSTRSTRSAPTSGLDEKEGIFHGNFCLTRLNPLAHRRFYKPFLLPDSTLKTNKIVLIEEIRPKFPFSTQKTLIQRQLSTFLIFSET